MQHINSWNCGNQFFFRLVTLIEIKREKRVQIIEKQLKRLTHQQQLLKATSMLLSFFINYNQCNKYHCVKCARIRVFSYQYFPYKDKIYDSFLIRENTVRQNLISGIFYAVTIFSLNSKLADIILAYNYSTRRGKINYWQLLISANLLIAFEKSYYQIPDIYLSLSI